jgi:hypothetical protein
MYIHRVIFMYTHTRRACIYVCIYRVFLANRVFRAAIPRRYLREEDHVPGGIQSSDDERSNEKQTSHFSRVKF